MPPGHAFHPGPAGPRPDLPLRLFRGAGLESGGERRGKKAGEPAWLPRASAVCHFRLCEVRRLAQRFNLRVRGGTRGDKREEQKPAQGGAAPVFFGFERERGASPRGTGSPGGEPPERRRAGGGRLPSCGFSFCGFAAPPPLAAPGPGSKRAAVRAWRDAGPTPRAGLCRSAPRPFLFALPRSAASRDVFPHPAVALSGCGPVRLRPVAFGCIRLWLRSTPFGDDLPHAAASGFGRVRPRFTASGLSCRQIGPAASAAERGFRPCRPGRGRSCGWSG